VLDRDGDVAAFLRAAEDGVDVGRIETRRIRMKHNLELKVQAWVDGELPEKEARRIGDWIGRDAEAAALAAELGSLKQAMLQNEAAAHLTDSREFYWSKVQRQIEREGGAGRTKRLPWYAPWRRIAAMATGAVALACVLLMTVFQTKAPTFDELTSTGEGMEAVSFHDQSGQMTVVWLDDGAPAQEEPTPTNLRSEDAPGSEIKLE
jgi:anti-sigma factor RsiW